MLKTDVFKTFIILNIKYSFATIFYFLFLKILLSFEISNAFKIRNDNFVNLHFTIDWLIYKTQFIFTSNDSSTKQNKNSNVHLANFVNEVKNRDANLNRALVECDFARYLRMYLA